MQTDVSQNRSARKWTRSELATRAAWTLVHPFFAFSPRLLWGWRRMMLRTFGAKIGNNVHVFPSVRILIPWTLDIGDDVAVGDRVTLYALGSISIGARATVSQGAHLCAGTHDWRDPSMPLVKPPIHIGADAWICADAFIGPGVTIGKRAIVGARAVAVQDVPDGKIAVGNPARIVSARDG